ncbi:MAG: hypothetical protein H7258_14810, partial [Ferruginibacter sp.]|nr:hypothetical protein [Ferruginibacter sp.]
MKHHCSIVFTAFFYFFFTGEVKGEIYINNTFSSLRDTSANLAKGINTLNEIMLCNRDDNDVYKADKVQHGFAGKYEAKSATPTSLNLQMPLEANPPLITYTSIASPTCIYSGMSLTGVVITDATGIPLSGTNRPKIYYRKNAGSWFSKPGINISGTVTNSTWTFSIVESDMGALVGADIISYYVIAEDLNPTVNVGSNPSTGLVATGVNNVITAPTAPNTYTLRYNLIGTYTVGTGGNFTNLTTAINAYNNACSLAGNSIFELTDNSYPSETFPINILLRADADAAHTLTIRPASSASPVITGASSNPIINLSGAKYISFDGRQGGTGTVKSLTFINTGIGTTFQFVNDAQNNNLKYCTVKGQRNSAASGTVFFGLANASGTGNDNNTIDNNNISDATSQSRYGIFSGGTNFRENSNNAITNNNISNYFNALNNSGGVYIASNSSNWVVTGNRFFQTSRRVYTANSLEHFGIYITDGTGYTISNNVIGYENAAGTGTTIMIGNSGDLAGFPTAYTAGAGTSIRYFGIALSLDLFGTTSTVDGNTISGIAMFTSSAVATSVGIFCGIYVESGAADIGANVGNTIGAATGSNAIYVATTGSGGTVVGIRAACTGVAAIQNNMIGAILASGTSAGVAASFVGINFAGICNFTVSNNFIGNGTDDNLQAGYALLGGFLSSTGILTATNVGITSIFKGISSTSVGNTLNISGNTLRGWKMSGRTVNNTGIESTGAMTGPTPSVNINNNFIGTAATNWLNATVDNSGFLYAISVNNTAATTNNIKNNDIRGTFFGTQNGSGGGLIRLTGATATNNIATINGNTFSNLNFRFATANLYFIFTSYSIAATGRLIIDNNRIAGTFNGTGAATYNMIHCSMNSASGARAEITNNNFSNFTAASGFASNVYGIYTNFGLNPCILQVAGNTFSNLASGTGNIVGIEIADMTGTASCFNNTISNINCQANVEGISMGTSGASGQFNVMNNTISGIVSTGTGGFIFGISGYLSSVVNTTQTNIYSNIMQGFSSTNSIGIISGIHLDNGQASSNLSVTSNKIYNLRGTASGSRVYGINNYPTLAGNISYANNYIGDLDAPFSSVAGAAITGMKLLMVGGQANVYYNTIHLNASGSSTQFSTAAVFADPATQITFRNNIFSNVSTHGLSGKTVAYWRGDNNTGTYDAASNNNVFYAGAASTQNLIYHDGTNSDQTITAYKTRVTPRDNLSVSVLPAFITTTGSDINFLHLTTNSNCAIASGGDNSGILLAIDYDGNSRSTTAPFLTDIGADEVTKLNNWTAASSSNWNDAGNWSDGTVPNADAVNVSISTPPAVQPVIASVDNFQVSNLIIQPGANLTNKGLLSIAGAVYANPASINNIQAGIVEGSVQLNGNCLTPQSLSGRIFINNSVKNLTAGNDVNILAAAGGQVIVSGALSFGTSTGKTLNTGDNLTLASSAAATANVEDITGNIITGKVTVERYINTGLIAVGRHLKSWQFLSTPTSGQTIFQSWQENGTTPAGYGTIITGTGSGFDVATSTPSMKHYNSAGNSWIGITNTGNPINDQKGYLLFVRGDRTVTAYNQDAVPTILRTKGTLYQPSAPPPPVSVQAARLASVGNPYASAINLVYMKNNGLFVNLNNDVTVWDPLLAGTYLLGGYQTLSAANNYEPTAGSTATSYYPAGVSSPSIQSGQAFFVRSSGAAGSVTFTETCKISSNRLVNRISPVARERRYFRATLFTHGAVIADGNAVVFDPAFDNGINADDAYKFPNAGENFGLVRNGQKLSVEARRPVNKTDTLFYSITNLRKL